MIASSKFGFGPRASARIETQREIGLTQRLGALPSPGARALMEEVRNVVARSRDFRADQML